MRETGQRQPATGRNDPRGFTLIELLVVIAIIALLVSILMPSLGRATRLARRTMCMTNLSNWYRAISMYDTEYGELAATVGKYGGRYPHLMHSDVQHGHASRNWDPDMPPEWSVDALRPYVSQANESELTFGGMWYCPAARSGPKYEKSWETIDHGDLDYAFFTRAEEWRNGRATHPEDLVGRRLQPGKLLMSDTIWRWWMSGGLWQYNHGQRGPTMGGTNARSGPRDYDPVEFIEGTNQLYGSGNVRWREASELDLDAVNAFDDSPGWVIGGGGEHSDRNLYVRP
ncbi:MAG: type II secretion system protein [Planctomycetota bacterium]